MTSSFLAISNYPKKRIFTNINYRWCIVKEIVFVQNKKRLLMKFEFLKKGFSTYHLTDTSNCKLLNTFAKDRIY